MLAGRSSRAAVFDDSGRAIDGHQLGATDPIFTAVRGASTRSHAPSPIRPTSTRRICRPRITARPAAWKSHLPPISRAGTPVLRILVLTIDLAEIPSRVGDGQRRRNSRSCWSDARTAVPVIRGRQMRLVDGGGWRGCARSGRAPRDRRENRVGAPQLMPVDRATESSKTGAASCVPRAL